MIDTRDLPPWPCCGARGTHARGCDEGPRCRATFAGTRCKRGAGHYGPHSGRHSGRGNRVQWEEGQEEEEVEPAVYCELAYPLPEISQAKCIRGAGHSGSHQTANGQRWGG